MAKKAVLTGKIVRVAKICNSNVTEFTVDVRETQMDDTTFTIGTEVSFMVENYILHDAKTEKVCSVAVGDKVTVAMEKHPSRSWKISSLHVRRPSCRPIKEYLKDLEDEIEKRNK